MTLTADLLRPHQAEIMQAACASLGSADDERYLLVYGGRGTMKTSTLTFTLGLLLQVLTARYAGYTLLVAAMTYPQLRDVFLAAWMDQVPSTPDFRWTYNSSTATIHLPNEGRIIMRHAGASTDGQLSAERAAGLLKGINCHGFYAPEARALAEVFYRATQLAVRAIPPEWYPGCPVGYRLNWLDANPDGREHWIYRRFLDPSAIEYLGTERIHVLGYPTTPALIVNEDGSETVGTSLYSAERLALDRAGLPLHVARRDLDAEWVGASGAVYHLYDGVQVRADPLGPGGRWYLSMDFGYEQDPYVCLLIYAHGGHAHVMGEVSRLRHFRDHPEGGMYALVRSLMDDVGADRIHGISGDLAGARGGTGLQEQAWWAEQFGAEVGFTIKERYPGWLRLTKAFLMPVSGSDRPILTIHPDCRGTIASLSALTWKQPKGDDVNDVKGDDHADALRYFIMSTHSPLAE